MANKMKTKKLIKKPKVKIRKGSPKKAKALHPNGYLYEEEFDNFHAIIIKAELASNQYSARLLIYLTVKSGQVFTMYAADCIRPEKHEVMRILKHQIGEYRYGFTVGTTVSL